MHAAALGCLISLCLLGATPDKPNILWLIADDVGWRDLGCYGHPSIRTPNLDWLAARGVRFDNAFVTSPQCSPSRTAMFSGRYAHSLRNEDLHAPVPEAVRLLPSYLREAGYWTANVGKLHLGRAAIRQFDFFLGWPPNDDVGRHFDRLFQAVPEDRPFFIAIGFIEAHRPFTRSADYPYRPEDAVVPPYLPEHPDVRRDLAAYYSEITFMDDRIGRLLDWLRRTGRLENTVIFFFSDNGSPFPRAKCHLADSGVGTPLIVYWPNVAPAGRVHRGLVSLVDLAPTVLDIVGLEIPEDWQGKSFLPAIRNPERPSLREAVYLERNWHDFDDHVRAVRTERYKLIRHAFPGEPWMAPADALRSPTMRIMLRLRELGELTSAQMQFFRAPRPPVELYDLATDPWEFRNVAFEPEYREVRRRLEEMLTRWQEATGDVPPLPRKPDRFDRWTGEPLPQE